MACGSPHDILHDFAPFFQVYTKRLIGTEIVSPGIDPDTGVHSKDVTVPISSVQPKDAVTKPPPPIPARLYLPKTIDGKLPVLVYFHGGAFTVESAFSPTYHRHLNLLVKEANIVAVSVDYRRAPDHFLPVAYEDSLEVLKWVVSHDEGGKRTEEWLKTYADFNRVYLSGDSAGANIAHNVAMLVGLEKLNSVKIAGIILNCPHFGGAKPIGEEENDIPLKTFFDNLWLFVYPKSSGVDDPANNPANDPNLSKLGTKRVLVHVTELDFLKHRGWYYKQTLSKSGWPGDDLQVVEVPGEDHVFYLNNPTTEEAIMLLKRMATFMNN